MAHDFSSSSNRSSDAAAPEAQAADTERADRTVAVPRRSLYAVASKTLIACSLVLALAAFAMSVIAAYKSPLAYFAAGLSVAGMSEMLTAGVLAWRADH